jgi:phage recombination protein Bet
MNEITAPASGTSLVARLAGQWGVEPEKLTNTLKSTAFKTDKPISNEQLMALLIVAEQYHLNPFTKELFAFADQRGGIVPFVSVDGWSRIVNEHPQYDGSTFIFDQAEGSMTCVMYRKDRAHPTQITEYLQECKRNTAPWTSHPRRMLRHKALIQCARIAFGFAGLYDEDEAERIRDAKMVERVDTPPKERTRLQAFIADSSKHFAHPADVIEPDAATPAPPASELQEMLGQLYKETTTRAEAEQLLDYGRSALSDADYAELSAVFADIFNPEESKQ